MIDFLLNLIPRIQAHSQKLDQMEAFIDRPWAMMIGNDIEKLVFRRNGELLMVRNGLVTCGKWEYIQPLDSLLIDRIVDKLLLKYAFVNKSVMLLKIDNNISPNIIPFVNEVEIPSLDYKSYLTQLSNSNVVANILSNNNLKVGDEYGGGIIYHMDYRLKKGLVVAKHDLERSGWSTHWYNKSLETGANSKSDGMLNTLQIVKVSGTKIKSAAKSCLEYQGGGFNDWFLPAQEQLEKLRESRYTNRLMNIVAAGIYWSSTESNGMSAYGQSIDYYTTKITEMQKYSNQPVKAIREILLQ